MDSLSRLNQEERNKKRGVIKLAVRDTHPGPPPEGATKQNRRKKHHLTKPTPRAIKLRSN